MRILYENSQWQITKQGIESVGQGHYFIEADRLDETTNRRDQVYYDWPVHLAEKGWVNLTQFFEAFSKALVLLKGKYSKPLDHEMLERSFAYARKLRSRG